MSANPALSFVVQPSDTRIIADSEYLSCGATISNNLTECDLILGVKEPSTASIIPNKHYFFFGHLDNKPPYNKPLFHALKEKGITFTDYELIMDNHKRRIIAFGYWAGIAGVYNTLRLYGEKYKCYHLPKLNETFTKQQILDNLAVVSPILLQRKVKILIIGYGRVAKGAMEILNAIGIEYVPACKFRYMVNDETCYSIVGAADLTFDTYGYKFDITAFHANPERFASRFFPYAEVTDILLCCHTYQHGGPVYLDERLVQGTKSRIRVVGDITCDVKGSVATTTRYSTHDAPFYDIDHSLREVSLFGDQDNISVMAVDNLPTALAKEASEDFSDMIYPMLIEGNPMEYKFIKNATMFINGRLSEEYEYLNQYFE